MNTMESSEYTVVTTGEIHEEESNYMSRREEERRLSRRRCITLLAISAVFLICSAILTISVVHDVQARNTLS